MTSRTQRRTPGRAAAQPERTDVQAAERIGWADVPPRLKAGVATAAAGAVLAAAGVLVGPLADAPPPGFAATALLVLLALLPAGLAAAFVAASRPAIGAAVLLGAALLAPGRALVDLQLAADALRASRPELFLPTSLAPLTPSAGLWLALAGHLLAVVAGGLAAGRAGAVPGTPYAAEFDDPSADRPTRARSVFVRAALLAGTVGAVGLLLVPFGSEDAFVLALDAVDGPATARWGLLALAVGTVAAAVVAGGAARLPVARGAATGLFAATAAVTLPQIAAGLAVERLHPAAGPYLALLAAAALTAALWLVRPSAAAETGDVRLDLRRLHRVTGVLGLLTAAAALLAGLGAQLVVPEGVDAPTAYASRVFLPLAALVAALSCALFATGPARPTRTAPPAGGAAAATRPALAVVLAGIAFAAAGSLDAAFTATGASGEVGVGAGVWSAGAALLLAAATAVTAAIAGGAERDDVDLTERDYPLAVVATSAVAGLLAVGAFAMPVLTAPDFVAPGVFSEFRFASWGLLVALVAVIAAAALAPAARPPRAAALLLGAAAVVGVRALEYPLTAARAVEGAPGQGLWLALAAFAAFVVAAATAVSTRR
ncbi:hypothetical protein ACFPM7_03795 [Actinokineospora guangxiensis]|uniref:Uncharacterized protein n=1 Tax=Actinokineospora guangxiensis TaxID=1490288 RepID=A0ABW0EGR4_9PSEU